MKVRTQVTEANEEELDYLKAKLCANSEEVCTYTKISSQSFLSFVLLAKVFNAIHTSGAKELGISNDGN